MKVKSEIDDGKLKIVCEGCNSVAMADILVSDNGQPFLQVTCRLCGDVEEIVLDSDAWPHLRSRISGKE
jgi:hypothetical protein